MEEDHSAVDVAASKWYAAFTQCDTACIAKRFHNLVPTTTLHSHIASSGHRSSWKTQQHNTLRCRWAQPHGENWLWWATYVHATQLKPRQTNSYCVTSDFKKPAKFLTVVHCFPYTSVYGMWMCLSTACTLTSSGEPSTKDRRHADKLSFPRSFRHRSSALHILPNSGQIQDDSLHDRRTKRKLEHFKILQQNPRTQGHWHWQHIGKCTHARIQHCLRGTVTMATSVEQEGKWPLWFGREATRTWRKSTNSKDFFDNFGREFSLPTNWFGKLETSWIHFCKKIAATYKLQISPTFRPIFQIGPRTTTRPTRPTVSSRWQHTHYVPIIAILDIWKTTRVSVLSYISLPVHILYDNPNIFLKLIKFVSF